jgi:hypothetical protein
VLFLRPRRLEDMETELRRTGSSLVLHLNWRDSPSISRQGSRKDGQISPSHRVFAWISRPKQRKTTVVRLALHGAVGIRASSHWLDIPQYVLDHLQSRLLFSEKFPLMSSSGPSILPCTCRVAIARKNAWISPCGEKPLKRHSQY